MRDSNVKLMGVDNGWAYVDINCTPTTGLSPETANDDPRGRRLLDLLLKIEGVTSVVLTKTAVMAHLRVHELSTAAELHRLARIMIVITTDVLGAPA